MKTLQNIIDTIIDETDIRRDRYTEAKRISDVSDAANYYIELAGQFGSEIQFGKVNDSIQNETLGADTEEYTIIRDNNGPSIKRIEFRADSNSDFICLKKGKDCSKVECSASSGSTDYMYSEKAIIIHNAKKGEYKITYGQPKFKQYSTADLGTTLDLFEGDLINLLWTYPALRKARYYSERRYMSIKKRSDDLENLFLRHFKRNTQVKKKAVFGNSRRVEDNL